jgi:type IV fimbrial biogenesis protein FimT
MLSKRTSTGFTLLELVVTMVVAAILMVLGIPVFSKWIHDEEIRSTAEAMQNALRLAQTESLNRNRQVVFALTNATPALGAVPSMNGSNWYAQVLPIVPSEASLPAYIASAYLQGGSVANSANGTTINGPSAICFNSLGRLANSTMTVNGTAYNCTTANSMTYIIDNPNGDRPLHVTVSLGGQVRMCDPAFTLSSNYPQGC